MCGIIGYVGRRPARSIVLAALQRLEARGYDSCGVALHEGAAITRTRAVGGPSGLAAVVPESAARTGLGHTRWATHGSVCEDNAHPFSGCEEGVLAVALNGIVENHEELRARLGAAGHRHRSATDAEVVAHLLEEHYAGDLVEAARATAAELEGHFAFVALHRDHPDVVVGTRRDVPLVAGIGAGEAFVASSIAAFRAETDIVQLLEDGDVVTVSAWGTRVVDASGLEVQRPLLRADAAERAPERGAWPTFMLKEIHEQPDALGATLAGRAEPGTLLPELDGLLRGARAVDRVVLVGCGTALHAGMCGRHALEAWARLPATAEVASEWRYAEPVVGPGTLVVGVSQSGETADTLAALRLARRAGAATLAVTNVAGSQITREVDAVALTRAGEEVGVAATKTFTAQVGLLLLLALRLAEDRGALPREEIQRLAAELRTIPGRIASYLDAAPDHAQLAGELADSGFFFMLGRGPGFATCLEGALKLRELTYIPTEAYPSGEMKHGPIALIGEGTPVIVLGARDPRAAKLRSNVEEVLARGARVIAVATEGDDSFEGMAEAVLRVPAVEPLLAPLVAVLPLQLLAHEIARVRGLDVDRPRNLAKTVTVE